MNTKSLCTSEDINGVRIFTITRTKLLEEDDVNAVGLDLYASTDTANLQGVAIDFTITEFLSSHMVGKLIHLEKRTKANNMRLALFGVRPEVYEVFKITTLNKLIRNFETREEALAFVRAG